MNKIAVGIVILILLALYFITTLQGLFGLGAITVYTDKNEYKLGEQIPLYSKNNGITILCGTPNWHIYKINGSNGTILKSSDFSLLPISRPYYLVTIPLK